MKKYEPFTKLGTQDSFGFIDGGQKKVPIVFTYFRPSISFSIMDIEKQKCRDNPERLKNLMKTRLQSAYFDFLELLDRRLEEDPEYLEKVLL